MEQNYKLDDNLFFTISYHQGATLNCIFNDSGDGAMDLYNIGISKGNLNKLLNEISKQNYVFWHTNDRSFVVTGRKDSLELEFLTKEEPFKKKRVLVKSEAEKFQSLLEQIKMELQK